MILAGFGIIYQISTMKKCMDKTIIIVALLSSSFYDKFIFGLCFGNFVLPFF
jgi:hypothetical protein